MTTIRSRLARLVRSPYAVGAVGAMAVVAGISSMFALQEPPFLAPDETAHLGYAHEIADFDLPEISEQPDVPDAAVQWEAERQSARDDRYRAVWVANHPPLNYLPAAPLIWWSELTDRADGGLIPLRLVNVAFAAIGVGFTYLLGRDLSGGVRPIGLAAAAIAALVPQGLAIYGEAMNDGLGFAATTAAVWAGVRCLRRRPSTRDAVMLGAAVAACAGARIASFAVAGVVVGFVAVDRALSLNGAFGDRLRIAARVAALGLGPAVALFGWFYVRNVRLYGDLAGSEFLLDRFGRQPRGSLISIATSGDLWVFLYRMLLSPSPLFAIKPPGVVNVIGVVAVAGVVVAVMRGRTGDREPAAAGTLSRRAMALGVIAIAVVMLAVAQHISGGGSRYARYLLPAVGIAAALVAIGLDRLIPRLLPAVVVVLMAVWAVKNVPVGVDPSTLTRPRDRDAGMPGVLRVVPSAPWQRGMVTALIAAGCVAVAYGLAAGLVTSARRLRMTSARASRRRSREDRISTSKTVHF